VQEPIDWFELRPEVYTASQTLSRDEVARLLSGEWLEDEEGRLLILSPEHQDLLSHLDAFRSDAAKKTVGDEEDGIVRIPRLGIFDLLIMARSGSVTLRLPAEVQAVMDSLLNGTGLKALPAPAPLKATLRDYQLAGFQWLAFLHDHRFGACLADDMGLGKTVQAIALLAHVVGQPAHHGETHLVVVPPSLVFNWINELQRFCPSLRLHEYTGGARRMPEPGEADVVVTTYDLVRRDIESLVDRSFGVVVFDEAQAVKTLRAARTKAVRQLPCRFKLCLTGTPVENHVGEYYSIIDLALPGLLGDAKVFRTDVKRSGTESLALRRAQFFVLRRTKDEILDELPPKIERETILELDEIQRELYTRTVESV